MTPLVRAFCLALALPLLAVPALPGPSAGAGEVRGTGTGALAEKHADAARATPRGHGRRFTVAVIPDTQQEVLQDGDRRFRQRTKWLARHKRQLDLRYAIQTGDLVNWGWLEKSQYTVASGAMRRLERADIPYSIAIGNHDTRAVGWDGSGGYGGDAYVKNPECLRRLSASECQTPKLLRRTQEFNAVFDAGRFGAVRGAFERGKVDNVYSTFRAGRLRWLSLSLELYPRVEAVRWARRVVAAHPRHNVMISTHSYIDGDGAIIQGAEYGATSPQYLFDNLVSRYRNVKLVFSGHVGIAGSRIDRGVHGNKIASFVGTFHSNTTNPVRLLTINPRKNRVRSTFVAPDTGERFTTYDRIVGRLDFVR